MANFIVKNTNGVLFKMKDSDQRYGDAESEYTVITELKPKIVDTYIPQGHNHKCKVQEAKNGKKYEIFTDWSALEIK